MPPGDRPEDATPNGAVLGPGSHRADANYGEARAAVALERELVGLERDDVQSARDALRPALGHDYLPAIRVVNRYLSTLPAGERAQIENATLSDGRRALNDPAYLVSLGERAMGPFPRDAAGVDREIEKLEGRMRTDRKGWFADEAAQLKLRLLYTARERRGG